MPLNPAILPAEMSTRGPPISHKHSTLTRCSPSPWTSNRSLAASFWFEPLAHRLICLLFRLGLNRSLVLSFVLARTVHAFVRILLQISSNSSHACLFGCFSIWFEPLARSLVHYFISARTACLLARSFVASLFDRLACLFVRCFVFGSDIRTLVGNNFYSSGLGGFAGGFLESLMIQVCT